MTTSQVQFAGFTAANIAEVEAATKALRATLRPEDYGSLGIYALGGVSGTMAVSLGAAADIFQFRWGNASNLCLVKRVLISAGTITAFTAQAGAFSLFRATGYTGSGSGGTSLAPGAQNKLRTSTMGSSLITDVRISSTGALGAPTYTVDGNALGSVAFGAPATAGAVLVPTNTVLLETQPGEYPLTLAQNEGFAIRNVVLLPSSGTWTFAVRVVYTEIAAWY